MNENIPRCDAPNPALDLTPSPTSWTWWAWISLSDPPLDLGRSPEQAESSLRERLHTFYLRDMDPLPDDPETRTEDTLRRYKRGALLSCGAGDEVAAFLAWKRISSLSAEEALLRWRVVFPAVEAPDPLLGLIIREEREGFTVPAPRARRSKRQRPT